MAEATSIHESWIGLSEIEIGLVNTTVFRGVIAAELGRQFAAGTSMAGVYLNFIYIAPPSEGDTISVIGTIGMIGSMLTVLTSTTL